MCMAGNAVRLEDVKGKGASAPEGVVYRYAGALRELLTSGEETIAEVARRLNCSTSKVSQYKDETYHTQLKKLDALRQFDAQVGQYLLRRSLRKRVRQKLFVETSHALRITGYLEFCLDMGEMRVMRAGTGCGKTHTVAQFKKTHGNVYVVHCDKLRRAQRPFLKVLYKEVLGQKMPARIGIDDAFDEIVEALRGQDALLVVDDSQHLLFNTFSQVASINDRAGIGVVFCDQSDAQDSPGYDRMKQYERNPQVWGRIAEPWSAEQAIAEADVRLFASHYGVTAEPVIAWLYQRVNTPKTRYRWLDKLLRYAVSVYAEKPERLNVVETFKVLHNKFWHGQAKG